MRDWSVSLFCKVQIRVTEEARWCKLGGMTVQLSEEPAHETEQTGAPLSVEDPRTHKLYLIVAAAASIAVCIAS